MTIVVIGSANQDYLVSLPEFPQPGETLLASGFSRQPGGKGANQAIAAARLGHAVTLVGCVGDDDDGESILRQLRTEGVDASEVEILSTHATGIAVVSVADNGENTIVVVAGANAEVRPSRAERVVRRLTGAGNVVLVQAEISPEVISTAIEAAEGTGARPILNLAPYLPISSRTLALCDPLVVNETEAARLLGQPVTSMDEALVAVRKLRAMTKSAVITLGASGAVWANSSEVGRAEATLVPHVVDSTGAGDAFVGALATLLANGSTLELAVKFGVTAGSFAVTKLGAQSSYPMREDIADAASTKTFVEN